MRLVRTGELIGKGVNVRNLIRACFGVVSLFGAVSVLTISADVACAMDAIDGKPLQSAAPPGNPWNQPESSARSRPYIVQAATMLVARREIERIGARPGKELRIIGAVGTELTSSQLARLHARGIARVYPDRQVGPEALTLTVTNPVLETEVATETTFNPLVDGGPLNAEPNNYVTDYPLQVGATQLQQAGINGRGVTIAVLDTGIWTGGGQNFASRILASVDIVAGGTQPVTSDPYGHGTHVASIAAGGATTLWGSAFGIAPEANLVIVRAFDASGAGSYSNVIAGLAWIIANKQKYNIRVVNLSFGAPPESNYWNDPLDQAVMAAWKAGIVVVASAGNSGPTPMTIGVPANVPYIITVGAMTDNFTPSNPNDDKLASFSSTGPTYEGFVKPELVAPGGHMVGSLSYQSYLASIAVKPMSSSESLFVMSGTSQAAAVTTGIVALMLQANPSLTPDAIKCHLIAAAQPALTSAGVPAYSIFQQGAGLVNAPGAVYSTVSGCANQGLNITADLAGTEHFGGPANETPNGTYYLMNMNSSTYGTPMSGAGYTWDQAYAGTQGYAWTQSYAWSNGYAWTQGYAWSQGYAWTQGYAWSQGYAWTQSAPWAGSRSTPPVTKAASIDDWVPNE
jgi:serine protease AprX